MGPVSTNPERAPPAATVTRDALLTFAGIEKVFLVKDGKAVEKNVATGRRAGDFIEILGGIKPGDLVVLNPGSLQNGQPVTVDASAQPAAKKAPATAAPKAGKKSS